MKTNLSGGIVGLANVGKSTFFQAVTRTNLGVAANYPFATIDPETARVEVPSPRLEKLAQAYNTGKVPASFQVVDIAGLVRGASTGQGLGNAFLSHIRAVDGLFQMVRCFDDEDIVHVEQSVDPIRDLTIIHDELVLKDMEYIQSAIKVLRKKDPKTLGTAQIAADILDQGARVDTKQDWTEQQQQQLRSLALLTTKPSVFVANISEEDWVFGSYDVQELEKWAASHSTGAVVPLSVNFESRLSRAEDQGAAELAELGVTSNLSAPITALRTALGLESFFTAGEKECREWTIRRGYKAPQAAGVIHTDLEKTFIYAKISSVDNPKSRREGKDYVVQDGDIIEFYAGGRRL